MWPPTRLRPASFAARAAFLASFLTIGSRPASSSTGAMVPSVAVENEISDASFAPATVQLSLPSVTTTSAAIRSAAAFASSAEAVATAGATGTIGTSIAIDAGVPVAASCSSSAATRAALSTARPSFAGETRERPAGGRRHGRVRGLPVDRRGEVRDRGGQLVAVVDDGRVEGDAVDRGPGFVDQAADDVVLVSGRERRVDQRRRVGPAADVVVADRRHVPVRAGERDLAGAEVAVGVLDRRRRLLAAEPAELRAADADAGQDQALVLLAPGVQGTGADADGEQDAEDERDAEPEGERPSTPRPSRGSPGVDAVAARVGCGGGQVGHLRLVRGRHAVGSVPDQRRHLRTFWRICHAISVLPSASRAPGATYLRMLSIAWALYSTPSWFGTVSSSVSAAWIAVSFGELLDEDVGLRGVGAPEDRLRLGVDVADLVRLLVAAPEVRPVPIVDQREDAAAHRDPRLALVAGRRPRLAEQPDLLGLELVERHAGVLGHQRRRHHVHALLRRPTRRSGGSRRPTRSGRAGRASAARGGAARAGSGTSAWGSARRTRRRRAPGGRPRCAGGPCRRRSSPSAGCVAEVAEAVDHLLRRAAADPELQATAGDEVGGAGVLGHVQRVLVAHVDDRGADLDALRPGADRGQQRERRRRAAGRSGGPGSTRRRRRGPRPPRRARSTG